MGVRQNDVQETVGVSSANIANGSELNIKITADTVILTRQDDTSSRKVSSAVTVTNDSADVTITGATTEKPITIGSYGGVIAKETKNQTITFAAPVNADIDDEIIDAGTYQGTLTFVAAVEPTQPSA